MNKAHWFSSIHPRFRTVQAVLRHPSTAWVFGGCMTGIAAAWAVARLTALHPLVFTSFLIGLICAGAVMFCWAATRPLRLERRVLLRVVGVGIGFVAFGYLSGGDVRQLTAVHVLSALGVWMVIGACAALGEQLKREEGTDGQEKV